VTGCISRRGALPGRGAWAQLRLARCNPAPAWVNTVFKGLYGAGVRGDPAMRRTRDGLPRLRGRIPEDWRANPEDEPG